MFRPVEELKHGTPQVPRFGVEMEPAAGGQDSRDSSPRSPPKVPLENALQNQLQRHPERGPTAHTSEDAIEFQDELLKSVEVFEARKAEEASQRPGGFSLAVGGLLQDEQAGRQPGVASAPVRKKNVVRKKPGAIGDLLHALSFNGPGGARSRPGGVSSLPASDANTAFGTREQKTARAGVNPGLVTKAAIPVVHDQKKLEKEALKMNTNTAAPKTKHVPKENSGNQGVVRSKSPQSSQKPASPKNLQKAIDEQSDAEAEAMFEKLWQFGDQADDGIRATPSEAVSLIAQAFGDIPAVESNLDDMAPLETDMLDMDELDSF